MHRELAREVVPAARGFDGIHVADQVGDGHIRRRQLLYIAFLGPEVSDGSAVTLLGNQRPATPADGVVGIVMNLAAAQERQLRIEQRGECAQNAALGLATQAQQNEIVSREKSVHQLGHDRIVIADNPGKNGFAGAKFGDQVVAKLVFDLARAKSRLRKSALTKLAQGSGKIHAGPLGEIIRLQERFSIRASPYAISGWDVDDDVALE